MNKNLLYINYVIYIGLLFYLLIDTFAGILISKGLPNIGLLVKGGLVFLMMISIVAKKKSYPIIISGLFFLLSLYAVYWYNLDFKNFGKCFTTLFKVFSILIVYLYCKNELTDDDILVIFKANYCIFVMNIFLGALGFGNNSYKYNGETVGTNGFFYAGNEVTYTFICLLFFITYAYKGRKTIFYLFNLFLSFLIGTKTGMLVVLLVIFSDMYFSTTSKMKKRMIVVSFICFIILIYFFIKFVLYNNILVQMIIFKFNQSSKGSHSILNALLSGRIERIPVVDDIYNSSWSFIKFLFGLGYIEIDKHPLEMDFFEMFYYYGIIGLVVILSFYLYLIISAYIRQDKKQFIFILITILVSFFVGHVTYSVMGGVFFCLINRNLKNINWNLRIKKYITKVCTLIFK
ncbi:MAG: O-antigen ligase family protein [Treponema sp.]|nr:O-antigen ligase family protein [Treponema sp.]